MFRRLPFQQQEVANADHGQVLLTEIGRTVLFDRQVREALLSYIARLSYDILVAYLQTQVTGHGCYSSCPLWSTCRARFQQAKSTSNAITTSQGRLRLV